MKKFLAFLTFRYMLTPILIQISFWLSVIYFLFAGINGMFAISFFYGLRILIVGIISSRIICEVIILFFRIHDAIKDIKKF